MRTSIVIDSGWTAVPRGEGGQHEDDADYGRSKPDGRSPVHSRASDTGRKSSRGRDVTYDEPTRSTRMGSASGDAKS